MSEDILRKQVREIIKKYVSENKGKELTQEGIIDGVFGHIKKVLKKGADKRFDAKLNKIASQSSTAKKQVDKFYKSQKDYADAAKDVQAVLDDLGIEL